MDSVQVLTKGKKINYIFLLLLLGLLILRFPFVFLLEYHKLPVPFTTGANIYYNCTYLLSAILIFLKRNTLSDYHIGFYSILIFIIAPIALPFSTYFWALIQRQAITPLFELILNSKFEIIISICLIIALMFSHPKLQKINIKKALMWFAIAIAAGIFSSILAGIYLSFQYNGARSAAHVSIPAIISLFFVQLGNAAVIEEPLFRGFLWGFLKKLHWKDLWIWLLQAGLFMIGHFYYYSAGLYYMFVGQFLTALILGLIAWRSRSIGTSMIVHAMTNSLGPMIGVYTW